MERKNTQSHGGFGFFAGSKVVKLPGFSIGWFLGSKKCVFSVLLMVQKSNHQLLGGGFEYFLFSPLFGEDPHFD